MRRLAAQGVGLLALGALVLVPVTGAGGATAHRVKPKVVNVRDDYYSPTKVIAKRGKTVKWKWGFSNTDSHDVTLKKGPKGVKKSNFRSIAGAIGITFQPTFKKTGIYNFYCTIHPDIMQMKVVIKR